MRQPKASPSAEEATMSDPFTLTFSDGTSITLEPRPPVEHPIDQPTDADCSRCGACCAEAGFVAVTPTDTTPRALTQTTKGLNHLSQETRSQLGRRCMKRHLGGRCVALEGVIGEKVACSIYEKRPAVCRRFEAGSPGCLDARDRMRSKIASKFAWRGYGANWQEGVKV